MLFNTNIRNMLGLVIAMMTLHGCSYMPTNQSASAQADKGKLTSFVVLGEHGTPIARVITPRAQCPNINFDGHSIAMDLRATAETLPLRATRSDPVDSKSSAFPIMTCEKAIPLHTISARVEGQPLPLPKSEIKRIVVIGDTGCRLKKSDNAYQACNDAAQYPFAKIAVTAANWRPDLVVHVGDYHYRENACPDGNLGCKGSSWGYGWQAWHDDFFEPASPLLKAAPWVVVRGNHESCKRAGQGWWRFIDPRPLLASRDCNAAKNDNIGDYSEPYAVSIGGDAQFIVMDTSNTLGELIPEGDIRAAKYRDLYVKVDALSKQAAYNIGINHHPILGFTAHQDKKGNVSILPGNQGLQSVFSSMNPLILPARINALLSGHVHLWQEVSFSSPHPTQFIAGFSGTMEDTIPLPAELPKEATPAPSAIVEHLSSWVNGFGFMTMERSGVQSWDVNVWDVVGNKVNTCTVEGKKSVCKISRVN